MGTDLLDDGRANEVALRREPVPRRRRGGGGGEGAAQFLDERVDVDDAAIARALDHGNQQRLGLLRRQGRLVQPALGASLMAKTGPWQLAVILALAQRLGRGGGLELFDEAAERQLLWHAGDRALSLYWARIGPASGLRLGLRFLLLSRRRAGLQHEALGAHERAGQQLLHGVVPTQQQVAQVVTVQLVPAAIGQEQRALLRLVVPALWGHWAYVEHRAGMAGQC